MDEDVLKAFRLQQKRKAQKKAEYDYSDILAELFRETQEEEKSEYDYDEVYCLPNGTLKNKLGITVREEAEEKADRYANARRVQMAQMRSLGVSIHEAGWNEEMLKDVHRALMGDMYDWAGEYRTVDVGVACDHVAYISPEEIKGELKKVFDYINENNCFRGMSEGEKIKGYTIVFGNLKNIQPFRDGNTRTAMVFTQLLAGAAGMTIDFDYYGSDIDRNGKEGVRLTRFRESQLKARDGDYNSLLCDFLYIVAPEDERPELAMPKVEIGRQGNLLAAIKTMTGEIQGRIIPKEEKAVSFNTTFAAVEKETAEIDSHRNAEALVYSDTRYGR